MISKNDSRFDRVDHIKIVPTLLHTCDRFQERQAAMKDQPAPEPHIAHVVSRVKVLRGQTKTCKELCEYLGLSQVGTHVIQSCHDKVSNLASVGLAIHPWVSPRFFKV